MDMHRGTRLGKSLVICRALSVGKEWGIYASFTEKTILLVEEQLMAKWEALGLIYRDVFSYNDELNIFMAEAAADMRLESLQDAAIPNSVSDAISFAMALKETRHIAGQDVNLSDGIFFEEYSRILPVFQENNDMGDDVLLGKWLTGGVPVSIKDLQGIASLMTWTSPGKIKKIAAVSGYEVESSVEEALAGAQGHNKELPQEDFVLPGRKELSNFINEYVVEIVKYPEDYGRMGIDFPGSILMYGPPGSGKTYAAEKLVAYLSWPAFYINSGTIGSMYIHETSRRISEIFSQAMEQAPSFVIIDEMESFLSDRAKAGTAQYHIEEVGEFLRLLQKAKENHVLVIAMTNMLDKIDPAIKRKGRFDHHIEVGMPCKEEILSLLRNIFADIPLVANVQLDLLAEKLQGKSLADVAFFAKEAGRRTARERKDRISQQTIDDLVGELANKVRPKHEIGFKPQ